MYACQLFFKRPSPCLVCEVVEKEIEQEGERQGLMVNQRNTW